jgi:hypothetical protein
MKLLFNEFFFAPLRALREPHYLCETVSFAVTNPLLPCALCVK